MSEPGVGTPSGISSGDVLILPERHPACRRHEARLGFGTERENLAGDVPVMRSGAADDHFPPACWSNTLSTASVMASTPVSMVGFGTGANKGEWLPGNCESSPSRVEATRSGS